MNSFPQQPTPVPPQVELPSKFPELPQEFVDRFNESAREYNRRLQEFWTKTNQAIQQAQGETAKQTNSTVVYNVERFLIYAGNRPVPMFDLDVNRVRLGGVLVVDTPDRKVFIGAGEWDDAKTPFFVDAQGFFSLGDSLTWNPETDTLEITGTINATTGTIGGFTIGPDYIRDVANTFGLSSDSTGGNDVRFWAGGTFASRNTATLRIYESGNVYAQGFHIDGPAGTARFLEYQSSGVIRWLNTASDHPETGANAGTNYLIQRFADNGAYIQDSLIIYRDTGRWLLAPESRIDARWNGIGVTSTTKLDIANDGSATAGLNQWSPAIHFKGDGWHTTGATRKNCHWKVELKTSTGAALPSNRLVFSSDISDTPSYAEHMYLGGDYGLYVASTAPNYFRNTITTEGRFMSLSGGGTDPGVGSVVASDGVITSVFGYYLSGKSLIGTLSNHPLGLFTNNDVRMEISNTGGVRIASLAGTGTRTVVADSSGNLSAP